MGYGLSPETEDNYNIPVEIKRHWRWKTSGSVFTATATSYEIIIIAVELLGVLEVVVARVHGA